MVMGERISRLMDGEVEHDELDAVWAELKRSDGTACWSCYHVIGDALRGPVAPVPGFSARFHERLAAEPTVLAPPPKAARSLGLAWAAAATVAAVAVVGWVGVTTLDPQATALAKAREAAVIRAAQVSPRTLPADYLMAHQEYSPTAQIPGVGSNLRAVSAPAANGR
jgi:sigma-E factor negative regulatory protein RseA